MIQSTVTYSKVEDRLDAEFYHPAKLAVLERLSAYSKSIGDFFKSYRSLEQPEGSEVINLVELDDIADFSIANIKRVKKYEAGSTKKNFANNDVLISRLRSYLKQIVFVQSEDFKDEEKNLCSTEFIVLRNKNKEVPPEFLYSYLQTEGVQTILTWSQEGSNHPRFSEDYLLSLPLPVKSPAFVSKIKSLIDESIQKREQARKKYEEARQLVNKFLGIKEDDFTFEQSFSLPFSKIEDRLDCGYYQPLELLELPMFKKGIVPLGQLTTINTGRTPAKHAYTQQGVRILKVRNLTNQGIDWDEGDRAYAKEEVWEKTKRARVKENDLLLISAAHQAYYIGQEIDIVFGIPEEYNNKLLAVAELLVVRPLKINPYLLLWYLRTQVAYRLIQRLITGETSHLYAKDLVNLPIPKKLLDFQDTRKVEGLTKESLLLKKESKNLLEQAKQEVEKIITQSP